VPLRNYSFTPSNGNQYNTPKRQSLSTSDVGEAVLQLCYPTATYVGRLPQ